jgi:hypothetical protein
MLQLKNSTPFEAAFFVFPDADGVDTLFVAVKATFGLGSAGVVLAEKQRPVALADEYLGEPAQSSLKYSNEAHIAKPASDIALLGSAHAPGERAVPRFDARMRVGKLEKRLCVFGERVWRRGLLGLTATAPLPVARLPVVWERAFGGRDEVISGPTSVEARNPVGWGFAGRRRLEEMEGQPLPNFELPDSPLDAWRGRPTPAGLGFVAPSWEPRSRHAGTYDAAWQEERAPYLPKDFDARFLNTVSADQVYDGFLQGGEPVELVNLSPRGVERFMLPVVHFRARVRMRGETQELRLALETLLLEPDDGRFCLTWRAAVPCDKMALKVETIELAIERLDGVVS